jgi:hypothetical protein
LLVFIVFENNPSMSDAGKIIINASSKTGEDICHRPSESVMQYLSQDFLGVVLIEEFFWM